jgi:hypothetical protein
MKDSVPHQDSAAGDATHAQGDSHCHLRLIHPPTPALCSDEHAHELPTQEVDHDVDPDDPDLTILAW